jgi:saccharopine dehydrogenase-like NADP-dependent oxidoreductase
MRAVVIGGFGNFGARICRALEGDRTVEVIASSRSAGARLDIDSEGFGDALRRLSPGLVVHCAGPFQGQDYRVASAALAAGADYLDLADGRDFVASFRQRNDAAAKEAGRIALSGASTLPALSSAVVDFLSHRFREFEEIHIVIAPGQRAPRGSATLAAVFSYAGRPFKWLQEGSWTDAWGWQELRRVRIDGIGTRWAAACDVPDLALLPARYPGVRTVQFRAALEVGAQHLALWSVAALRRVGVPLPIERWVGPLDRMASCSTLSAANAEACWWASRVSSTTVRGCAPSGTLSLTRATGRKFPAWRRFFLRASSRAATLPLAAHTPAWGS